MRGSRSLSARLGSAPKKRIETEEERASRLSREQATSAWASVASSVGSMMERERVIALLQAAERGDLDECARMVETDASLVDSSDDDGATAMHAAARGGSLETVEALLDLQFDDEAQDKKGQTALHVAAASGNSEIIELLIDIGIDPDLRAGAEVSSWTPLMYAAAAGQVDVIGILLNTDADLVDSVDTKGNRAVDIAWVQHQEEAANALIMADEARRMRSKKQKAATMHMRRSMRERASSKRILRKSSSFDLDAALEFSHSGRHSETSLSKLSKGFRRVSAAAGAIAAARHSSTDKIMHSPSISSNRKSISMRFLGSERSPSFSSLLGKKPTTTTVKM